jgi:hypothetical protein
MAESIKPGIQRMVLKTQELYPKPEDYLQYKAGYMNSLKSIPAQKSWTAIMVCSATSPIQLSPLNKILVHPYFFFLEIRLRNQSLINASLPVKKAKKHRFWPTLAEAGFISFKNMGKDTNTSRTRALLDLSYESLFKKRLVVFYSMPSPSSEPKWSGIAGLRRLFGARALRQIAEIEKKRVDGLISKFIDSHPIWWLLPSRKMPT